MKVKKLPLLQIFLFICFCAKAADASNNNQKALAAPSLERAKGFTIPFEPKYQPGAPNSRQFGFSLQLPGENSPVLVYITMRSNGIWINNSPESPWKFDFHCEKSPTCKDQGPSEYWWIESNGRAQRQFIHLSGTLVKEQVTFEGGFTLPNTEILIVKELSKHSPYFSKSFFQGALGLSPRPNHQIPSFLESLKTEGIIEKSIFSIYLNMSNHGELTFGGYDPKRARPDFHYAKWEYYQLSPGFLIPVKRLGYGNTIDDVSGYTIAMIDFDTEGIHVPRWMMEAIDSTNHKARLTCNLTALWEDIVIGFEEFTLRIPSTVYANLSSFERPIGPNDELSTSIDCTYLREIDRDDNGYSRIVLGRQFLKYFYTVFNLENQTVGFSTVSGFPERSPVFETGVFRTRIFHVNYERVQILLAIILIAICLCVGARKAKSAEPPSTELVSQVRGQYAVVNESQDDSQQEEQDVNGEVA